MAHLHFICQPVINYDSEETNLYDVLHSLKRLCAVKEITKETVEYTVLDREQAVVFPFSDTYFTNSPLSFKLFAR